MKEFIKEKIAIPVLSAFLGLAGGYSLHYLTEQKANLEVTITQPMKRIGENIVFQILTINNSGNDTAKRVRLEVRDIQPRMHENLYVDATPMLLKPYERNFSNKGDLLLSLGDLQPNSYVTIILRYKRPLLNNEDINVYADNAISDKVFISGGFLRVNEVHIFP